MGLCSADFNPQLSTVPADYTVFNKLNKMRYSSEILSCKFNEVTSIKGYFNPNVDNIQGDIKRSRSIRVFFEKYRSAYERVNVQDVTPTADTCPQDVDIDCNVDCTTTKPEFEFCDIIPTKIFSVGASACTRTEKFSMYDVMKEFTDNVNAVPTVIENFLWNQVVCETVANPVDLPVMPGSCITSTYRDFAGEDVYTALSRAVFDLKRIYNLNEITLFAHPLLEQALFAEGSSLHQYINTGIPTVWGNQDIYSTKAYSPMPALPRLWGAKIIIAGESPYDTQSTGENLNAFISEDGTKFYVVMAMRDAVYSGSFALQDEPMRFYPSSSDCDPVESWKQEWLFYSKILCPDRVVVLAFDLPTC